MKMVPEFQLLLKFLNILEEMLLKMHVDELLVSHSVNLCIAG